MTGAAQNKLVEVRDVKKNFGSVQALKGVNLSVCEGEVCAIVADNGAGKSTLVKILTGAYQPSSGAIEIEGREVALHNPDEARRLGIEALFQDLALADDLTIWQNLYLGRELTWGGPFRFVRRRAMSQQARHMLDELHMNIPSVGAKVRKLSGGQRQRWRSLEPSDGRRGSRSLMSRPPRWACENGPRSRT
jgi:D-xylose transport system ATP-binding protein